MRALAISSIVSLSPLLCYPATKGCQWPSLLVSTLMSTTIAVQRTKSTSRLVMWQASCWIQVRETGLVFTNTYGRVCYIVRWRMSWATQLSLLQTTNRYPPPVCISALRDVNHGVRQDTSFEDYITNPTFINSTYQQQLQYQVSYDFLWCTIRDLSLSLNTCQS